MRPLDDDDVSEVPGYMLEFFKSALETNRAVESFEQPNKSDAYFIVKKRRSRTTLKIILVDEYTLGISKLIKILGDFPEADYVVTGGKWNHYSTEAKEYGKENGVGVFVVDEFLRALFVKNPKEYVTPDE